MSDEQDSFTKYKDLADFLLTRIGFPAVVLAAVLWFHFHEFNAYKKDMDWKLERITRNERSIMQKLEIPVILDGEREK